MEARQGDCLSGNVERSGGSPIGKALYSSPASRQLEPDGAKLTQHITLIWF